MPEWTPQVEVDVDLARELIAAQFPEIEPRDIQRFAHGWDNVAYLVNETYIFRFPQREIAAPLIRREIALLPAIASQVPGRISAPTFVGKSTNTYRWQFAGYPIVPGATASSAQLDEKELRALAQRLGTFLRALHAIDPRPLLAAGLVADEWGRFDHARRSKQVLPRIHRLQAAGELDDASVFLDDLERLAPMEIDDPAVVVHGDLYARHVIVATDGSFVGVIDWGDLHHGYRSVDLAVAHLMLPRSAHAAFIQSYGQVTPAQWNHARYRAIHHALTSAEYGLASNDPEMLSAGRTALTYLREVSW